MIVASRRFPLWLAIACAGLVVLVAWSFSVGRFPVSIADVWRALWAGLTGGESGLAANVQAVVTQVRAPRVAGAIAVGAALAAAGAAYQGLFKNPLVSPDILGVTAGCALGAGIAILMSMPVGAIQALAFVGGLLAVGLVILVGTWIGGRDPILTLVLTGVVVGSLFGAGIALVKYIADPYNQLPAITFWLMGSFASASPTEVRSLLPAVALALAVLIALAWRVNLLALPEDEARALGVNTRRLRAAVIAAATLATSASVAVSGIIGWVGLVVPHMARLLVGPEFSRLLPVAALIGAAFMLAIDTLARTAAPIEVPPGILTAVVGTPVFIVLLARARRAF